MADHHDETNITQITTNKYRQQKTPIQMDVRLIQIDKRLFALRCCGQNALELINKGFPLLRVGDCESIIKNASEVFCPRKARKARKNNSLNSIGYDYYFVRIFRGQ